MELTINIKEPKNIASFLNLIRKFDYVEIVDVKEHDPDLPIEHRKLLDERLMRVKKGKAAFKNWDSMKKKYEEKVSICNLLPNRSLHNKSYCPI